MEAVDGLHVYRKIVLRVLLSLVVGRQYWGEHFLNRFEHLRALYRHLHASIPM
jgi:hypothetical protein